MIITSPHNDKLKEIRKLARRRERDERGRFVAEGEDLVAAAARAGWAPVHLLCAAGSQLDGELVEQSLLDGVSGLGSGSRTIGVYEARWGLPAGPLCVYLHGVADPGNVGTILRSALAFGADSVVLGPGCADPFGPKAVRASMGAIFDVVVARAGGPDDLPGERIALVAGTGSPLTGPAGGETTLVVGAERAGLPAGVVAACDRTARIPIASESLNAAMAATVALYELTRGGVRMIDRIAELRAEAEGAIATASGSAELEELRVRYLGRKAELPNLLRGVGQLAPAERGPTGKAANQARQALEAMIAERGDQLASGELESKLETDAVDVTLPGAPPQPVGRLHLLTATRREIEDVFLGLGFKIAEGPEVETVYYNFDALNHAPTHPARGRMDTFYVADDVVLRTHTSPMQIRAMEAEPPPLYVIVPGRVYRRDSDATHTPQFHQIEGLAVDEDITLADLKGTLLAFARAIFGPDRDVRLRPHFFPFTEPSVEVDVSCFNCKGGFVRDGSRCTVCKGTQWLEILGSGMVDPNVFAHVAEHGYDPERVQGFAFGMGIERIAMLKHAVPDLRLFYDNDVRFLEQFG